MANRLIYVNGDSFTWGADLAETVFFDQPLISLIELTDPKNFKDLQKKQIKFIKSSSRSSDPIYLQKRDDFKNRVRWTHRLEEKIKTKVINASSCGCANENIYHRTYRDIMKLKNDNYIIDKILIQFTSRDRRGYILREDELPNRDPNTLNDQNFYDYYFRSVKANGHEIEGFRDQEKRYYANYHDLLEGNDLSVETKLVNYLQELKFLKDAIYGATGIKTILIDSIFLYWGFNSLERSHLLKEHDQRDKMTTFLLGDIFPKGDYLGMAMLSDPKVKNITPGLHYNHIVHELLAEKLAETLF
jgi:hypothetical protein